MAFSRRFVSVIARDARSTVIGALDACYRMPLCLARAYTSYHTVMHHYLRRRGADTSNGPCSTWQFNSTRSRSRYLSYRTVLMCYRIGSRKQAQAQEWINEWLSESVYLCVALLVSDESCLALSRQPLSLAPSQANPIYHAPSLEKEPKTRLCLLSHSFITRYDNFRTPAPASTLRSRGPVQSSSTCRNFGRPSQSHAPSLSLGFFFSFVVVQCSV